MPTSPPPPNSPPDTHATEVPAESAEQELAPEDFYYEGPYLVFTAAYHLKRGSCCRSDCRHCPYGKPRLIRPAAPNPTRPVTI